MAAVLTNQPRRILGALTTTFTAPPACWTPAHHPQIPVGWLGQYCAPTDIQDDADCWPPTTTGAPRTNSAFFGWGFYSPGLECPAGYTSACTASATSQGWRIQFRIDPEETFVGCCPEGYACHNENGQTCISKARATTFQTYQCESGSTINLAPMTLPNTQQNWSQAYIYAPMIQLAWKISDLPTEPRPSATADADEPSGGGISTGAIAGIAVGAAAVVIAIVVGAFLLWRMKRRGAAQGGSSESNIEYTSIGKGTPPPVEYAGSSPDDQVKQMNHYYSGQPDSQQWHPTMKESQMTPYELGQTEAPAELGGVRWDVHGRAEAPGPEVVPMELESPQGTSVLSNTLALNHHPCPFAAFGSVIVNHTSSNPQGDLVCTGSNQNSVTGNPTLHGEMAAINNCSKVFLSPAYNMTPAESLAAFKHLTIYTNAESCPMCAAAVRWAGFREYVYGVSIRELIELGWEQLDIGSEEVIGSGVGMRDEDPEVVLGEVRRDESRVLFGWQFGEGACPKGCGRWGGSCVPV
ncbi:hypothetical protein QBC40DRAFT_350830 [Triangularia verruculosa]|uniref:CMP/dCMP-type deaminase domain-containing protein n=1 Tax=Triangularia verruculosa TaxID=2587418 RepID=A0AAN6XBG5_9PEZI|nr:hypothetical protein QBC40DRAFT_350830 [Triangularia verruculosa]